MSEIAELYNDLRPLYDAYKHGYRVAFATNEIGRDVFTYFDIENEQNKVSVNKDYFNKVQRRANSCHELFKLIFALHKERIGYEKSGSVQNAPITIHYYLSPSDPTPNEEDRQFIYPTRGEILNQLRNEGNTVYSTFKEELEKSNRGKIVAIDMDEKKIIESDYDLQKVIQTIRERNSSSRIFVRRVGKDETLPVEIY
jgi:hypothetical protein